MIQLDLRGPGGCWASFFALKERNNEDGALLLPQQDVAVLDVNAGSVAAILGLRGLPRGPSQMPRMLVERWRSLNPRRH